MPYASRKDLEHAAGGLAKLVQLADRNGDGVPDDDYIAGAQAKAEGVIDSYAGKRYRVPIANPSNVLVQMAADETIFQLALRGNGPTQDQTDDRELRHQWLKDLSEGKVTPSDPPPQKASTVRSRYVRSARAVSREKTKGFW